MAAAARREQLVVEGLERAADTRGERQLAWAVLETAFNDLTAEGANQISKKARMEARLFCTNLDGEWAHSRRKWCDLAELDESSFVRAARRVVNANPHVMDIPQEGGHSKATLAAQIVREYNPKQHNGTYRPAAGVKALAKKFHVSHRWVHSLVHEAGAQ
jgi:hypothetical protein